ncbi:major facilitator superfamily domain-containing protein [Aspergillus karnatakaensis]|uniref:major facilitator superfamily domain-containing protein n=1 Tax=Aspergillus karnatakaensis TaxID=1810916 RepID=UPI003CCE1803
MVETPETNEQEQSPPTDDFPEGGYGWICVICIFFINAHTWGINSAYGVILSFYLSHDEFPGTPALVYALVSGLSISCALLIAPVVTSFTPILSLRFFVVLGAILEAGSMIGASFTTQSWQLFLSQGICFSQGLACLFMSTVGIPNQWFKKRRGIANGIVAAGSGTGGLIYSLATNRMIEQFGFRWAFRILGIISFTVNLSCGMLVRERRPAASVVSLKKRHFLGLNPSLFRKPTFLLFLTWGFFSIIGYIALLFSLASYAQSIGLSSSTGSLASALLNLGQALGRPLVGFLSDHFGRIRVPAIATALCGFFCLVFWPLTSSPVSLFAFSILAGMEAGTIWASAAAMAAELVELPEVGGALSILWLVLVAPGTVAEVLALELRGVGSVKIGKNERYFAVQMFTGAVYLAAAGALALQMVLMRREKKRGGKMG